MPLTVATTSRPPRMRVYDSMPHVMNVRAMSAKKT